ncbi:TIGR02680 family protein [Saccharopolyspora hirsuta]|uniref:TIGR02680 family protein n=1 Tax=Saccharopolyspora hirsuta TaxID=1837 RepID=UPI0033172B93
MTRPRPDGERWLSAALAGELPEPGLLRWQPLRVGIVNLWEYDQAEFWFADGRLVLRGGNGAGKTKVLELTTLMLLRGEIGASVLDPFGSQHRTMRFNLLPTGEDDDPRPPADAGLGYAWAEFGRLDEDGTPQFFVCGMGVSARRGSGTSAMTPWHLITRLRPGRDLHLATAGRPLDQKELKKVPGVAVPEGAARYRARLASELFGLSTDAYDNLTELLKQLRRPKLGERLNPSSLADTLRAALPPLASTEITQLADGWDNLEKLRAAVEETRSAAVQLAAFVRTGWIPWARTVVRQRADKLSSATTVLDDTTKDRRSAERALTEARDQVVDLQERVDAVRSQRQDHNTELRELLESQAFQDASRAAGRVDGLRNELRSLDGRDAGINRRHAMAKGEVTAAAAAAREAADDAVQAELKTAQVAQRVEDAARPAGLHDSAARFLLARDLAGLRVDLTLRRERFAQLRSLREEFESAERVAIRSGEVLSDRRGDLTDAAEEREEARCEIASAVETVRRQIREWNAAAVLARADERKVEDWCDLVAELTVVDLAEAQRTSPAAAMARHVDEVRETLRSTRADLTHERSALLEERERCSEEFQEVVSRTERPPDPPSSWRRRDRPNSGSGEGAPLWRCVQPAGELTAEAVSLLEATLAAAGLLDAWITPEGRLTSTGDGEPADTFVHIGPRRPAVSLTAVLEPTPAGGVPESAVRAVLAAVGWHDSRPAEDDESDTWLAADGTWRCAALTGRAEIRQPASYLGATAREAARQREIQRLREKLAELDASLSAVEARIEGLDDDLRQVVAEAAGIPGEGLVTAAVTTLRERDRRVADCERKADVAEAEHRDDQAARDAAWAAFSAFAGEHALPLNNLDSHDAALQKYQHLVDELAKQVELLGLRAAARDRAERDRAAAEGRLAEVDTELQELNEQRRQLKLRLHTAEQALTTDNRAQLNRRTELDRLLEKAERDLDALDKQHSDAQIVVARAEETLSQHEERRRAAEKNRDTALAMWWEVYDAGLAPPLGLAEPERRTVESARESTRAARRELPDAVGSEPAWRRCYSKLEALRQELLPDRDVRVLDSEDDNAVPRVGVLVDSSAGWQAPAAAADLLADQVQEQEAKFDSEQQRVLTTLLGSTFIEHLKDRLDYTARTFKDINVQLTSHPTRHGNAVQLNWQADPTDPDAGAVVEALSQGYQQLSTAKQEAVRAFLARKIDEAREDASAKGSGDWREQLSTALDYRSWLKLSLQYRSGATSRWVPFDAAKHGAKSGGEKVVLLSQPLFAAAVVAYNAASEHAPRCVWLDEAMTGVDEEIKASFMGLTVSFDLDVMLTAHDEWCKYPTVPAVAVYDLARHKGLPGVDAVPYLWCGGEWKPVPAADQRADEAVLTDGLFAEETAD